MITRASAERAPQSSRLSVFALGPIALASLPFARAQAKVDLADDGTFTTCASSRCTEISYAGGTFVFDVTGFTTYSAQESTAPVPEFSDFALIAALVVTIGGFIVLRRDRRKGNI